jgi:hypothetical protein
MSPFQVFSAVLLAVAAHAIQLKETDGTWGPSDSVHALDGVIAAVDKIAHNPHLSPENLAKARHVAEDIKGDIEAVEGGNLTKQQAHEKVGAAIKELTAFEADLHKMPADRLAMLKKQLAEKEGELKKDKNMMKLLKLKKQLIEKKLMLQKLLAQKASAEDVHKADEAEVAKTSSMVKKVLNMTKGLEGAAEAVKKATLQAVATAVQTREREVAEALAKADAEQKKGEASLDAAIEKQLPAKGKGDAIAKGQSMLKLIKTQERRKFAKARALKEVELKELKEAQAKVEKKDIAGLEKVLAKLQQEGQALQAKSGNFLH